MCVCSRRRLLSHPPGEKKVHFVCTCVGGMKCLMDLTFQPKNKATHTKLFRDVPMSLHIYNTRDFFLSSRPRCNTMSSCLVCNARRLIDVEK